MTQIPYLPKYKIKPKVVSRTGQVTFTDGANDVMPNQKQCEAYGYTYDKASGTCRAFKYNPTLVQRTSASKNNKQGDGNMIESGAINTYVMGESNIVRRGSRNSVITGAGNEIDNGISNVSISGRGGQAFMENSIVLGGNNFTDRTGTRQTWTVMYGGQTTDNSTVDIYPNNGNPLTLLFFEPQVNRLYYFQSETMAVRIGGTSGSGALGDFKAWVERGVVKCNGTGTLSIERSRTSPASNGTTTGWVATNAVSGSNFQQTVKGVNNMTIEWVSTIKFMQLSTGVTLP